MATRIPTDRLCNRVRHDPIRVSIHADQTNVRRVIAFEGAHDLGLDGREAYPTHAAAWRTLLLAALDHRLPTLIVDGTPVDVLEAAREDAYIRKYNPSLLVGYDPIYTVVHRTDFGTHHSPFTIKGAVRSYPEPSFFETPREARDWARKQRLVADGQLVVAAYPHDINPEKFRWQEELIGVVDEPTDRPPTTA